MQVPWDEVCTAKDKKGKETVEDYLLSPFYYKQFSPEKRPTPSTLTQMIRWAGGRVIDLENMQLIQY